MVAGESPARNPEAYRQAADFCERLRLAVELREQAEKLDRAAHDAAHFVLMAEVTGLPFRLEVSIPEGTEAYVTHDDDVVAEKVDRFVATVVREISKHGVEFIDRETNNVLRVKSTKFDVSPILPLEVSDEPTP